MGAVTRPGLVVDLGGHAFSAAVGATLVPDPVTGEYRWPTSIHWDGERVSVGGLAEHQGRADPSAYCAGFTRGLAHDTSVLLGARRFRPVELVAELLAAVRAHAQRAYGPIDRAVVTMPADCVPTDPRRSRLLTAAEAAGFTAVELLAEPIAAVSAPRSGPACLAGDLLLVLDLGVTAKATLLRVGDDHHEIVGHSTPPALGQAVSLDDTLERCRDLIATLGTPRAVLAVGGGWPGVDAQLVEAALGAPVVVPPQPELAVVRGAAHWLPHSGARIVPAHTPADRLTPLSFPIPGGPARLLRWLVRPQETYEEGAVIARVRLAGGSVWELAAQSRGVLDQTLVAPGAHIAAGDWLALVDRGVERSP